MCVAYARALLASAAFARAAEPALARPAVVGVGYAVADGIVAVAEERALGERQFHEAQDIVTVMDLGIVEAGEAGAQHPWAEAHGPACRIPHGGLHGLSVGEEAEEERRIQAPLIAPADHGETDLVGHPRERGCEADDEARIVIDEGHDLRRLGRRRASSICRDGRGQDEDPERRCENECERCP